MYRYSVRTSISSLTQRSPFSDTGDTTTEGSLRPAATHWSISDRDNSPFRPMSAQKCPFSTRYPQRLVQVPDARGQSAPVCATSPHLPCPLPPSPISIERPAVSQGPIRHPPFHPSVLCFRGYGYAESQFSGTARPADTAVDNGEESRALALTRKGPRAGRAAPPAITRQGGHQDSHVLPQRKSLTSAGTSPVVSKWLLPHLPSCSPGPTLGTAGS